MEKGKANARKAFAAVIDTRPDNYAAISGMLGRPDYYSRTFVTEGKPAEIN